MAARTMYSFADIEFDGPTPQRCEQFAKCTRPAAYMVSHPVLDWVPTCAKCCEWLKKLST